MLQIIENSDIIERDIKVIMNYDGDEYEVFVDCHRDKNNKLIDCEIVDVIHYKNGVEEHYNDVELEIIRNNLRFFNKLIERLISE